MPIYQYECQKWACGTQYEAMKCIEQRQYAPRCPKCKGLTGKLVITPVRGIVKNPAVPKGKS